MIESQYTANVGKKLSSDIMRTWKINDNFAGGVPDAFYRHRNGKRPLWAEYKFIKTLPKRPTTFVKPNLSAQQLLWLNEAVEANELAVVIIGCEAIKHQRQVCGVVLTDPSEWVNGITAEEFANRAEKLNYTAIAAFIEETTLEGGLSDHRL
ncbi:hypothetical protein [Pseudoalteromonas sp. Xi13]|uniref:hypothetical protein n=1 Tax=Pseudoalteromonas TaxID=53246 RepID=UPI000F7539C6|nr:hypothetical protein [Pseudoalteromonas sp. Xi13]AZN32550.1 hypothetical protein EJ103_07385 [Pseudoalteromonas sp. Xi13]